MYYLQSKHILLMLGNVLKNYGSLTTMRILSRLFQFAVKTYLIRTQLDEQILAHLLYLQLVLSASLHLVKSCFKPSYQKVGNEQNIVKSAMNLMTLGILVSIVCSIAASFWQYFNYVGSGKSILYFPQTIALYAVSAIFQAIAEKYMVECTIKYQYFKIGLVQVISVIPQTLFIFFAASFNLFSSFGILIFGIGTILYSFVFMLSFFIDSSNKSVFLQGFEQGTQKKFIDSDSKQSFKGFVFTSILKFLLHQFQKIVLAIMEISHISSVYSLISNLGSMIVRYLFAPLNEIIFNYFSRGDIKDSIQALVTFIHSVTVFSVLIVSFGYNYSQILLTFLYGQRWVSPQTVSALRTYMLLVVFLGYNGVIQAFLFARGKESITRYNFFSIITTCIYLASTAAFLYGGFGASGLFVGNIVNMALRIMLCWMLEINRYISFVQLLRRIKPSLLFIIISVVVFFVSHKEYGVTQNIFSHIILKFLLGAALFGINLLPILYENRRLIIQYIQKKLQRKGKTE